MAVRDEAAVRRFVERTALLLADWGFPRMAGRVLLTLMSAEEPGMTAAELAERMGVSPAAISGAVRYLGRVGLVDREPVPGSRADRYLLRDDAWYTASVTKGDFMGALADRAEEGVAALGGRRSRAGRRVADMADFFRYVEGQLPRLLEEWQATRAAGGPRDYGQRTSRSLPRKRA